VAIYEHSSSSSSSSSSVQIEQFGCKDVEKMVGVLAVILYLLIVMLQCLLNKTELK
jgi:hypothetical protein